MRFTQKQMKSERRNAVARYRKWSLIKTAAAFMLGTVVGIGGYHYKDKISFRRALDNIESIGLNANQSE